MLWMFFFAAMGAACLGGAVYLVTRFHRFGCPQALAARSRALSWLLAAVPVALLGCFALINVTTLAVVFLHLLVIWPICDLIARIVQRRAKHPPKRYWAGIAALGIAAAYLGVGWYLGHHVFETRYEFETAKELSGDSLRIVELADCHLGITQDGESFARLVERVRETQPDAVVIVGDFVDDDSERADMLRACNALGELRKECGVYFAYGNHDNGYYNYRDFSSAELREALERNGVTVLEDEAALVEGRFYIVGRRDRSMQRAEARALTEGLDPSRYIIMLDHQPNDYANEAESGADLVLSGHTHGGHIFPAGYIGIWMGANDRVYGTEVRNGTRFLVTSGVSGWAIPFKTGTRSEYVVIDITNGTP